MTDEEDPRLEELLMSYAPASRNLCPPRHLLAVRRDAQKAHLAACPLCREDLADLDALAMPRFPLVLRLARGLVEVVENALGELSRAEPALARSGEGGAPVTIRRDLGGGALLEVSLALAQGRVDVLVRTLPSSRFRLELLRAGAVLEGRESEEGRVLLDAVATGSYELLVHRPNETPLEVALEVTEAR